MRFKDSRSQGSIDYQHLQQTTPPRVGDFDRDADAPLPGPISQKLWDDGAEWHEGYRFRKCQVYNFEERTGRRGPFYRIRLMMFDVGAEWATCFKAKDLSELLHKSGIEFRTGGRTLEGKIVIPRNTFVWVVCSLGKYGPIIEHLRFSEPTGAEQSQLQEAAQHSGRPSFDGSVIDWTLRKQMESYIDPD